MLYYVLFNASGERPRLHTQHYIIPPAISKKIWRELALLFFPRQILMQKPEEMKKFKTIL